MSAQEDFDLFAKVAELLELDEDESSNFMNSAMKRRGHKPRIQWDDSDGDTKDSSGDFFSSKRRTKETERKVNKGWQYGSGS